MDERDGVGDEVTELEGNEETEPKGDTEGVFSTGSDRDGVVDGVPGDCLGVRVRMCALDDPRTCRNLHVGPLGQNPFLQCVFNIIYRV